MVLTESRNKLKVGDSVVYFKLPGVDGKDHATIEFKSKPFLIIFMCNHCPYVKAKIDYIKKLQNDYKNKVQIIGINSNDSEDYPEDSFENMKKIAKLNNYNFIYLFDETQDVAKGYGASCTPDPFLFDNDGKLVYHGRLNNQMESSDKMTKDDMRKVFDYVLKDKKIDFQVFPSIGCSIKWKR